MAEPAQKPAQAYEEYGRARSKFYEASKASPDQSPEAIKKLENQILAPARSRFNESVRAVRNEMADGENQLNARSEAARKKRKGTKGPPSRTFAKGGPTGPSGGGGSGPRTPVQSVSSDREQVVLDGSNVPKEVEFVPEAKPSPVPKAPPKSRRK